MCRNQSSVGIDLNAVPSFPSTLAPGVRSLFSGNLRFGMLTPYPPTLSGLARFGAGLSGALVDEGHQVDVIRVADDAVEISDRVVAALVNGSSSSAAACATHLDACDVALIQHHDDIYGGTHGDALVGLISGLRVPAVLIVHSVPKDPAPHQRWVLEGIVGAAQRVVVMSNTARERLCTDYAVERAKVVTIPHGAVIPSRARSRRASRPTILTWGLLREGKGIERVIDAMASLRDMPGRPRYLVVGQTHPEALRTEGESYRESLVARAKEAGLGDSVVIDGRFYDDTSLIELVQSVSAVVLPYDSTDQVTSGVLVDALVRGRPVVATAFPHAVELLSGGAGILVDHDEPGALAAALRRVLTQPRVAGAMAAEARSIAPQMAWPLVGREYTSLARQVLADNQVLG